MILHLREPVQAMIMSGMGILIKLLPAVCILLLSANIVYTQPWQTRFEFYGYEDGLRQYPSMLFEDSRGMIWLGATNGIYRYDGLRFNYYSYQENDTSAVPERLTCSILEEDDGWFMIGTSQGLLRFNPFSGAVEHYNLEFPGIQEMQINYMIRDSRQNLWLATMQGGLLRYDPNNRTIRQFSTKDSTLNSNIVHTLVEWKDQIWVGTEQGLAIMDVRQSTLFHLNGKSDGLPNNSVRVLSLTDDGSLWMGLNGGYVTNVREFKGHFRDQPFWRMDNRDQVTSICQLEQNSIWIGTFNKGLYRFNLQSEIFYKIPANAQKEGYLRDDDVYDILCGADNTLWVLTRWGLNKHDGQYDTIKYYPLDVPEDLWIFGLTAFAETSGGYFWVGSWGNGLYRFTNMNSEPLNYKPDQSRNHFRSRWVTTMLTDSDQRLWVGCDLGLALYDSQNNRFTYFDEDPQAEQVLRKPVSCLMQDQAGHLWVGSSGGLVRRNQHTGQYLNYVDQTDPMLKELGFYIGALEEDAQHNIWIGGNGLFRLNPLTKEIKRFDIHPLLNKSMIFDLQRDRNDNMWVAAYDGLFRIAPDSSVTVFTCSDGLPSTIIYRIVAEDSGKLWITTFKGLVRFDPIHQQFEAFYLDGSFLENEFGIYGAYKAKNGALYFGQAGRFVFFNPREVHKNKRPPATILDGISLFDQPLQFDQPLSRVKDVEFSYLQNMLTFQFCALSYSRSAHNRFSYRLDHFDSVWQDGADKPQVTYANLQPGRYIFRVKAANSDGFWGPAAAVDIMITPPWWQNSWVRAALILLLLSGVSAYYWRRIVFLKKQAEERRIYAEQLIKAQEKERRRIGSELHDSHGQNLIIASNELEQFLDQHPRIGKELKPVLDTVHEAIKEVRTISSQLHPHVLERLGLVQAIRSMTDKLGSATGLRFKLDLDEELVELSKKYQLQLFRIVQEALNNVVKHAGANRVEIRFKYKNGIWQVLLMDDGCGFDVRGVAKTVGLGLADIQQRAEMLAAELNISSEPQQGTQLQLRFKI